MICEGAGGGFGALLSALVSFVELVLNGDTPTSIGPFFFGANLTALCKKGGGIRPIAVRGTLRLMHSLTNVSHLY